MQRNTPNKCDGYKPNMLDILTDVAWKELRKIDIVVENENLHHRNIR